MKRAKVLAILAGTCLMLAYVAGCAGPAPAPAAQAITPVTKLDVGVGTPPPEGWKWVIAELNTGADEVKEASTDHGFFWVFYVIKGGTEVTTTAGTKLASAGEGIMISARQQHSHRHLPQSKVLVFDVRSANDNPDQFHRATKLLVSDKIEVKPSSDMKLRVQEVTVPPNQRMSEDSRGDPAFVYVAEGKLMMRSGDKTTTFDAGKAATLPLNAKYAVSNEGATPLRFLIVDVRP